MIDIEMFNKRLTLANLYAPSSGDHPNFFHKVISEVVSMDNELIVIGGDWNVALNSKIDSNQPSSVYRARSRNKIIDFMNSYDLVDVYRTLYIRTLESIAGDIQEELLVLAVPWRIGLWDLKGWRRTSWVLPGLLLALWLSPLLGFPLLLLRLWMTPILMSGAVGKAVLVVGFAGGASARRAAAHYVAAVVWT